VSAQCPELPIGDEAAGELEQRFVDVGSPFPADAQATEAVQQAKPLSTTQR
jgi:hypothetical protein